MLMGTMMGAFAESLTLARGADLPLDTLLQVLDLGAMANPMFKGKGPAMAAGNFAPNFPLKHAQKDMR
jgi:glyoxylate/succinic semialdehyde reductase